jgi:predicted flap endonuclease-1-like 5' DNA nuclease
MIILNKHSEFITVKKVRNISPNMSTAAIFTGVFVLFVVITFIVPVLPPAQLLIEVLNIPQPTLSLWGVSLATLFLGVLNGLLYGLVAVASYSLFRQLAQRKPLPSIPIARDTYVPPPRPIPLDYRADRYPPAITMRLQRIRMEQDVEMIEGIGPLRGRMLRIEGIRTVGDLLSMGATRRGRQRLANNVGVSYATMDRWIYRGDLLRVRGVGKQYSELLETAGVSTVTDLAMRDPKSLWQRLRIINREKKIVRRIPPSKTVEIWVHKAKNLEPIIA